MVAPSASGAVSDWSHSTPPALSTFSPSTESSNVAAVAVAAVSMRYQSSVA